MVTWQAGVGLGRLMCAVVIEDEMHIEIARNSVVNRIEELTELP